MNLRLRQLAIASFTALPFLSREILEVDGLYISLNTAKAVFEPISQCWEPLMDKAGDDTFLTREEYTSFIQYYLDAAQEDNGNGNSNGHSHGHSHGDDGGFDIIVNNFNGSVDPNAQVFDETFEQLIDYCKRTELCDKNYDKDAFPVFAQDVQSVIATKQSSESTFLLVVCDKTVEKINDVYNSFGRDESFIVDLNYQFYSAINMTEIADVMIYQWDKFLRDTEVSHPVGYDKTSVEVTGNCKVEEEGAAMVEETDLEIKCYEVTLSMEARTAESNPFTNEEVAADIQREVGSAVEDERLGFACKDTGCRIAMYIEADDDGTRPGDGNGDSSLTPPKPKNFLPLYLSMGGAAFVGLIIGVLGVRRCRGQAA